MPEISGVACGTDFTDAATLKDVFLSGGGAFQVDGNPAKYQLQYGGLGVDYWTDDATIGTGGGTIPPGATGVRFKNATAGLVATVSALIRPKTQPHLSLAFSSAGGTALNIPAIALAAFPPAAPVDGDSYWLTLAASFDPIGAKAMRWLVTYDATAAMWDVAGAPLYNEVVTSETTASAAYVALATAGPAITLPRPGDYQVEIGVLTRDIGGTNYIGRMSYDIGGVGAVDADSIEPTIGFGGFQSSRIREKVGLTAVTLTAKYRSDGVRSPTFQDRYIQVTPMRIT